MGSNYWEKLTGWGYLIGFEFNVIRKNFQYFLRTSMNESLKISANEYCT